MPGVADRMATLVGVVYYEFRGVKQNLLWHYLCYYSGYTLGEGL